MTKQPKTISEAAKGLSSQQILLTLQKALQNSLGVETSVLIFKTLKLVYRFDEQDIPSNIDRFDELVVGYLVPT